MGGLNLNLVVGRLVEAMGMELVGNLEVFVEGLYLVDHMWGAVEFSFGDCAFWKSIGLTLGFLGVGNEFCLYIGVLRGSGVFWLLKVLALPASPISSFELRLQPFLLWAEQILGKEGIDIYHLFPLKKPGQNF